jgi:hypothetical protein
VGLSASFHRKCHFHTQHIDARLGRVAREVKEKEKLTVSVPGV